METKNKISQCMLVFMCFTVFAGSAAAEGWYLGASSGKVENRNWCDANPAACDDEDSAWKIFVGNRINSFVAFEFGYNDFGEMSRTGATSETNGMVASLIGIIPLGNVVSVTGRAGAFHWDNKVETASGSSDNKRTNLAVGFGFQIALGKKFMARVELEHFGNVNKQDNALLSAGIAYNFAN